MAAYGKFSKLGSLLGFFFKGAVLFWGLRPSSENYHSDSRFRPLCFGDSGFVGFRA